MKEGSWNETFKFNRFIHDTSEVYLKVTAMQKEQQVWKLSFKYTNFSSNYSSNYFNLSVTGEQDRGYRYRASYCEIEITESTKVIGQQRINLNEQNFNKFEGTIACFQSSGSQFIPISVNFGCEGVSKPEGISYNFVNKMLEKGFLTDFNIKTKRQVYPCHKLVLANCSEYFMAMFLTPMKESEDNILNWEDVFDDTTVKDLLQFIYTGSKPPNISATSFTLIQASHLCLLEILKDMCAAEIIPAMTLDNVVEILSIGEKYESDELKEAALNFIVEKFDHLEGDPSKLVGWSVMEPEMIKSVFMSIIKIIGRKKIQV